MRGGFLVTSGCIERAYEAFISYKEGTLRDREFSKTSVSHALTSRAWSNLDELYLNLYLSNLFGYHIKPARNSGALEKTQVGIVGLLFDIEMPKISKHSSFKETLLDEIDVSDLRKVFNGIKINIPYQCDIKTLTLGCIYIEVAIFAKTTRDGDPLVKAGSRVKKHLASITDSRSWRQLRTNYPKSRVDLHL